MKSTHGRVVHVESLDDLDRRLAAGASSLRGWRVRGLDVRERGAVLRSRRVAGAMFLGCAFAEGDDDALARAGAVVLPVVGRSPLDEHRSRLYTGDELYDASIYAATLHARAYAWSQRPATREDTLAAALHDHAIDEALLEWARGRSIVGVMGGHALRRGEPAYADAAHLGAALGRSHVVATGGGPGAMEAANLGGRLAHAAPGELDAALATLARVPSFDGSIDAWLEVAREVLERGGERGGEPAESLGIPTWHYGHEPPNVFATAIAAYVRNATREAVLLEVCTSGIVFLPGAAGTVQEVFQDACENYYADESSVAPMVLVGRDYFTRTLPAWPLLQSLARGRAMEGHVHLVETVEEAAEVVLVGRLT